MKTPDSVERAIADAEWTPERIVQAESPYYPLCKSGQLCPLLDDEELLYDFYVTGGLRKIVKSFCKTHRWHGRPKLPVAMTDAVLKKLIRSMCNSREARQKLKTYRDGRITLHSAIWAWLAITDKTLFDTATSFSHKGNSGKYFMTPAELDLLFTEVGGGDAPVDRHSLIYVGLAFSMLEPESCVDLVAKIIARYPETVRGFGLSREPIDQSHGILESIIEALPKARLSKPCESQTTDERIEIAQSNTAEQADCWIPHIDDLVFKTQMLTESSERFVKEARRLAEFEELKAFSDSGDAALLLSSLQLERGRVLEQSNIILPSLASSCKDVDGNGCELEQFVRQIQDNPVGTLPDLAGVVGTMRQKADDLVKRSQEAREEIEKLRSDASDLFSLLQSQDDSLPVLDDGAAPCKIAVALSEQRNIIVGLRKRISAEITKRKDVLNAEGERLRKQYDLSADTTRGDCFASYADLRSRIAAAEDIGDIQVCETLIGELEAMCRASERFDSRNLASRLQKEPEAITVYLDLCRAFVDQRAPEVAYFLLHLRQDLYPFEEIAEVLDPALSLLLETTGAVATAGSLPLSTVWQTLCAEPWLVSIGHADIESSDLHERIVVVLMGAALAGQEEKAAAMLARIGAGELGQRSFPERLNDILQAVVTRRPIQIVSQKQLVTKYAQECDIRERIAYEGGKYRHLQCSKGHHFARFESMQIFPALSELWDSVSSDLKADRYDDAGRRIDNINVDDWYLELNRKLEKPVHEHPHFSGKIRSFMQSFVDRIQAHVAHCKEIWVADHMIIAETEFVEALEQWAGTQKARLDVSALIKKILVRSARSSARPLAFWHAISLCPSVIQRCPHFVTWFRAQQDPTPEPQLEQLVLGDLSVGRSAVETIPILEADSAWEQLSILSRSGNVEPNQDWANKHKSDVDAVVAYRKEVLALTDTGPSAIFDACVQEGRLPAAREILHQCRERKAKERALQEEAVSSFVDAQLKKIDTVKDIAACANMPVAWMENVSGFAAKIDMQMRRLRHSEEQSKVIVATQERLGKAVEALSFVVKQQTRVFDEIEHHLQSSPSTSICAQVTTNDEKRAIAKCPDLYKAWSILARADLSDENELLRVWNQLVKEFAKVCNLYRDEHDEKKRFAKVLSIKYPFSVYQTAFYKPQSEFLKRPLRLYLYRQCDVDIPALQRLESELSGEDSAAWLHVVFALQGPERMRRYFKYDQHFKDFLLIDEAFLHRVSLSDKHDVPVRQALHASVTELASSTPFVAQGYCHQTNNIYVGRKDIIQKLLNTPQAMIWGGRRIGKTSVLHALESALRRRNYNVAYVYVDLEDEGDPDLSIAQKVSATLGLQPIKSIQAFERQITDLRRSGSRLAFLIDEVDEYIKKSRLVHGDGFPLATTLRQLVMDDSSKDTVLVYSGYHQLYYEAKLDTGKRRVGHPFINIAQDIPIRNLTHDDVKELVTTGFEEMLGIGVDPEVPPLIFKRASSHPAFVQQFCRCLLERASQRRSPGTCVTITSDDVEAVYGADTSRQGGEQPFILYVNETLGYNLSHLGRAIMLTICHLLRPAGELENDDRHFSIRKVNDDLNQWCEILGVKPPETEHFQQTIELLVMTNMLTQSSQEHDEYRVTYPTYIDILSRLDKLGRTALEHSLQEYDKKERVRGVLL